MFIKKLINGVVVFIHILSCRLFVHTRLGFAELLLLLKNAIPEYTFVEKQRNSIKFYSCLFHHAIIEATKV